MFELSLAVDDLRVDVKTGLEHARRMGFRHVDLSALQGPVSPREMSRSAQRHFSRHLSDLGLNLGGLRGPVGGPGYGHSAAGERRLETLKSILELAAAIGVRVVSTALGDPGGSSPDRTTEALRTIADQADRTGVAVAIDTAGVGASELGAVLRTIDCPLLGAGVDSGALLIQGDDPYRLAERFGPGIRQARARDAIAGSASAAGRETRLGEGQLDPAAFVAALAETMYQGPIILSRTGGDRPGADILSAKQVFEQLQR